MSLVKEGTGCADMWPLSQTLSAEPKMTPKSGKEFLAAGKGKKKVKRGTSTILGLAWLSLLFLYWIQTENKPSEATIGRNLPPPSQRGLMLQMGAMLFAAAKINRDAYRIQQSTIGKRSPFCCCFVHFSCRGVYFVLMMLLTTKRRKRRGRTMIAPSFVVR